MAKIGTAYIQIVPKLSEESVAEIVKQVTDAVAEGVRQGLSVSTGDVHIHTSGPISDLATAAAIASQQRRAAVRAGLTDQ